MGYGRESAVRQGPLGRMGVNAHRRGAESAEDAENAKRGVRTAGVRARRVRQGGRRTVEEVDDWG